jgi:hypothetical protein
MRRMVIVMIYNNVVDNDDQVDGNGDGDIDGC